jgi:hypothetical protein
MHRLLAGYAAVAVVTAVAALSWLAMAGSPPPAAPPAPPAAPADKTATPPSAPAKSESKPAEPKPAEPKTTDAGAAAPLVAKAEKTLRIGAWNIEWCGQPGQRGFPGKNLLQSPEDVADYLLAAGVDVLALEEISDTTKGAGEPTNSVLTGAFDIIRKKTGREWKLKLFLKREGEHDQLTGLAWDAGKVTPVGEPLKIDVPEKPGATGEPVWKRIPYAMKFSAGAGLTDFVVVPVHMKSNSNRGNPSGDSNAPAAHRGEEAEVLLAALPKITEKFSNEHDIIIAGDTNCLAADEPALAALVKAGFKDLNGDDKPTHHSPGTKFKPAPFDRILVPKEQPEFKASAQTVFHKQYLSKRGMSEFEFRKRFSDHAMVFADIAVMADDD